MTRLVMVLTVGCAAAVACKKAHPSAPARGCASLRLSAPPSVPIGAAGLAMRPTLFAR